VRENMKDILNRVELQFIEWNSEEIPENNAKDNLVGILSQEEVDYILSLDKEELKKKRWYVSGISGKRTNLKNFNFYPEGISANETESFLFI
jgi:hypothetical protein